MTAISPDASEWRGWSQTFDAAVGYALCGFNRLCAEGWLSSDWLVRAASTCVIGVFFAWIIADAIACDRYGLGATPLDLWRLRRREKVDTQPSDVVHHYSDS